MEDQRKKKLEQIRGLLDKAASTEFPAEAEALREKADNLMLAYSISEFEIQQRKPKHEREKPASMRVQVVGWNNVIKTQLISLAQTVFEHCRCRAMYSGLYDLKLPTEATVVGFPSDLAYAEMLYTSLMVQMARDLEPKPRDEFSYEENLALLKESGLKWERIWEILHPEKPWERRHGVKFTKTYTDFCKATGRERLRSSPMQYQRNFAAGFQQEVDRRLFEIRQRQKQDQAGGTGMTIALRDMSAEVDDLFRSMGPGKARAMLGHSKYDHAARATGKAAGARADIGQAGVGGNRKELA